MNYISRSSPPVREEPPLKLFALWDMKFKMLRGVAVSKERCGTRTRFPCGPGRLAGYWLRGADLVPFFPAPSDTIAAPSKMAAATADPGAGSPQAGDSSGGGAGGGLPSPGEQELSQRLQRLYPAVNQHETPLPRSWSPKDKYNYIGLSQGNLRVHYKGIVPSHRWGNSAERLRGGSAASLLLHHVPFPAWVPQIGPWSLWCVQSGRIDQAEG